MALGRLCTPSLLYLIFSITQIVIDTIKGLYNMALVKIFVTFIFTIILNSLCESGLGIVSWIIVFIPFILMTIIVAILLLMFGLDPATGKMKIKDNEDYVKKNHHHHKKHHHNKIDPREKQKIMDLEKKIKKTAKDTDTLTDEINKVISDPKKKTVLGSEYNLGEK
jgi:predicted membrane protein